MKNRSLKSLPKLIHFAFTPFFLFIKSNLSIISNNSFQNTKKDFFFKIPNSMIYKKRIIDICYRI